MINTDNKAKITKFLQVRYKDESKGGASAVCKDGTQECFQEILNIYKNGWMKTNSRYIYNMKWKYVIPTLGEVRGKMVFINMDNHGDIGLSSSLLSVKDDWYIDGRAAMDKKLSGMKKHIGMDDNFRLLGLLRLWETFI